MHIATVIFQCLINLIISRNQSQIQMHCHNPHCLPVQLRYLGDLKLPQPDVEPREGDFLQQRLLG